MFSQMLIQDYKDIKDQLVVFAEGFLSKLYEYIYSQRHSIILKIDLNRLVMDFHYFTLHARLLSDLISDPCLMVDDHSPNLISVSQRLSTAQIMENFMSI